MSDCAKQQQNLAPNVLNYYNNLIYWCIYIIVFISVSRCKTIYVVGR